MPCLTLEVEVSTSSDPQGPGPTLSDTEGEVSASYDPQGLGYASSGPPGTASPHLTPVGRIPSRLAPRERFSPRPILGDRICYQTKAVVPG